MHAAFPVSPCLFGFSWRPSDTGWRGGGHGGREEAFSVWAQSACWIHIQILYEILNKLLFILSLGFPLYKTLKSDTFGFIGCRIMTLEWHKGCEGLGRMTDLEAVLMDAERVGV